MTFSGLLLCLLASVSDATVSQNHFEKIGNCYISPMSCEDNFTKNESVQKK